MDDDERHSKEEELATYIVETRGTHCEWSLQLFFTSVLYLINVIGQIFFTDCFLGFEFAKYGVSTASFLEEEVSTSLRTLVISRVFYVYVFQSSNRVDPMSRVFPRMTKCTFKKYGPSGTIQNHDAQCVLPINIINEKIYVFLWFWFCILTVITILNVLFEFK